MNIFAKLLEKKQTAEQAQLSLFFVMLAAFTGGSVPVAGKYALAVFHPFTVVFLRFLLASLFLLPLVYKQKGFSWHNLKTLFPVGLIGALNPILLFIALQFTKASFSPLIYACIPALTALYSMWLFKHKIENHKLMGIAVGLLGVGVIVLLPYFETGLLNFSVFGNMLIFLAALAFLLYGFVSKKKQTELKITPLALTFYFAVVTLLVSFPFMLFELYRYGVPTNVSVLHVASAVWVGLVGTSIFYLSYQYALKHGTEVTASLFTYLQPISGILLAAVVLHEQVTLPFMLGGVLAVAGAAIASKK